MGPDREDAKVERLLAEGPWLRRLAGRVDDARAEDLAQQALLVALLRPAPRGRLRAWLAAILRNLALDARRRDGRRARREALVAAAPMGAHGAAEDVARAEAHARVAAAIRDLPEPYRSTVRLHFFEGLSLADIARRERCKDSTVRNRLRRALAKLRARLEPEFGGAPLALLPLAVPGRHSRLSFGKIAAAAALLAGAVYAGTPSAEPRDEAPARAAPPPKAPAPEPPSLPPVPMPPAP